MGALHKGHITLIEEARRNNDVVVVSIFVNPTQFDKVEDLEKYPRQLNNDINALSSIGVDYLFVPDIATMYGKNHVTYINPEGFDDFPEAKSRPGHFRGVATIVVKLLNIILPTVAYFGQKDAVQCALVRRLVEDLNLDLRIKVIETVRENDGLAMSSRNLNLSKKEREVAPILYKSLCAAKEVYRSALSGKMPIASDLLSAAAEDVLRQEPLVAEIQYVSVSDKETMKPINEVGTDGGIVSLACKIGFVRLIDNIEL